MKEERRSHPCSRRKPRQHRCFNSWIGGPQLKGKLDLYLKQIQSLEKYYQILELQHEKVAPLLIFTNGVKQTLAAD
jgi:hypothetical protein